MLLLPRLLGGGLHGAVHGLSVDTGRQVLRGSGAHLWRNGSEACRVWLHRQRLWQSSGPNRLHYMTRASGLEIGAGILGGSSVSDLRWFLLQDNLLLLRLCCELSLLSVSLRLLLLLLQHAGGSLWQGLRLGRGLELLSLKIVLVLLLLLLRLCLWLLLRLWDPLHLNRARHYLLLIWHRHGGNVALRCGPSGHRDLRALLSHALQFESLRQHRCCVSLLLGQEVRMSWHLG
mmetsp:Transcript_65221/g.136627  ORF Transcript_65221/g.136627 Transcript_65221/m.136627 type:complete len:232 (+) Transcript_65221:261-956(+)